MNLSKEFADADAKKSILYNSRIVNISTAVVIEDNGRFLLVKEDEVDRKGLWNFPSGKMHVDELVKAAAEREVAEETGLTVEVTHLLSMYYYQTKNRSNKGKSNRITIRFNFWGKVTGDVTSEQRDTSVTKVAWKTRTEVEGMLKQKEFRNWVAQRLAKEALAGKKLPLDFLYATVK